MEHQCASSMFGSAGAAELCEPLDQLRKEHGTLREQMDSFASMGKEIGSGAGGADLYGKLKELAEKVFAFADELDPHSEKEEGYLFPMMAKYIGRDVGPIAVMEYEHEQAKQNLNRFKEEMSQVSEQGETDHETAARIASYAIKAQQVLTDHFMKEENVLFPMAQNMLSAEEKDQLVEVICVKGS